VSLTPSSGEAPLAVEADASGSSSAAGVASYRFEWGDGSPATGPQPGATANHTYSDVGTFTVTVTVTDTAGLSSTATAEVTVGAAPDPNLVGNPGFETGTGGWNANGRTGVTLTRVAGGHSGGWAAELANTTTAAVSDCTLNDAPNWVTATTAGTYRASVWVRNAAAQQSVKLRLREYSGGLFVGSSPITTATVGATWTQLTTDLTVQTPGSTIDLSVYTSSAPPGACFTADDVSITRL
jgi:PKD repeat protein